MAGFVCLKEIEKEKTGKTGHAKGKLNAENKIAKFGL
jgi:hypothetical protein